MNPVMCFVVYVGLVKNRINFIVIRCSIVIIIVLSGWWMNGAIIASLCSCNMDSLNGRRSRDRFDIQRIVFINFDNVIRTKPMENKLLVFVTFDDRREEPDAFVD